MSDYPELDKQHEVQDEALTLSQFVDWLGTQGLHLMAWRTDLTDTSPCRNTSCYGGRIGHPESGLVCKKCAGTGTVTYRDIEGWIEDPRHPEQLLAAFFGIDLAKIEAERRQIIDQIRNA